MHHERAAAFCEAALPVRRPHKDPVIRPVPFVLLAAVVLGGSDYSFLNGRLQFSAPKDWREVRRASNDSVDFVAFVLPRPQGDPNAPAGNVMIDVSLSGRHWDLRRYSDMKVSQVAAGPGNPVIVDDKVWEDEHTRTVLWTSRVRETPYVLWDKLAARDSIYVDIRTAIPVAYANDSTWEAAYENELQEVLNSFRIRGVPVFATTK